jgi:hypothetical protein
MSLPFVSVSKRQKRLKDPAYRFEKCLGQNRAVSKNQIRLTTGQFICAGAFETNRKGIIAGAPVLTIVFENTLKWLIETPDLAHRDYAGKIALVEAGRCKAALERRCILPSPIP